MKNCFLFVFLVIAQSVLSCTQLPEADFYEVDGIVSIEAKNLSQTDNWQLKPYQTSKALVSKAAGEETSGSLRASIYIQSPGAYTVWTLSAQKNDNSDENTLPIRIAGVDGFLLMESQLKLPATDLLEWTSTDYVTEQPVSVSFESAGLYHINYLSRGKGGYVVDKIHLSKDNETEPTGRALPETSNPNIDPVLAKRDQRIVIPPAWVFGTLLGEMDLDMDSITGEINRFSNLNLAADALWVRGNEVAEAKEIFRFINKKNLRAGFLSEDITKIDENYLGPASENFSEIADFSVLSGEPDMERVIENFEASQHVNKRENARGFILAPMNNTYNPDFKKYPSIRSADSFLDPELYDDVNEFGMDVLRRNIEMVSNSRLSAYEIPFLVPEIEWGERFKGSEISEELFLRWIQFTAFNSVFNLSGITQKVDFDNLSDEARNQLKVLSQLRNMLFPYIYSKAHFIRAGGTKPVRGDGVRTTQFKLGDAFLVAPIFEMGADQRTVYFPEGTWYDYFNGTRYSGGQSWVVEASTDKIPVFVKAGSIIPYRDFSRQIGSGSNESLTIEIYGDGVSSFRLYEDDGITTNYQRGDFTTTAFRYFEHRDYSTFTIGRMVRSYQGQPDSKNLLLKFKYVDEPESITANENLLKRGEDEGDWHYDENTKTLYLNWTQPNYEKTDFRIEFIE